MPFALLLGFSEVFENVCKRVMHHLNSSEVLVNEEFGLSRE
jgi:hypothetical protein